MCAQRHVIPTTKVLYARRGRHATHLTPNGRMRNISFPPLPLQHVLRQQSHPECLADEVAIKHSRQMGLPRVCVNGTFPMLTIRRVSFFNATPQNQTTNAPAQHLNPYLVLQAQQALQYVKERAARTSKYIAARTHGPSGPVTANTAVILVLNMLSIS